MSRRTKELQISRRRASLWAASFVLIASLSVAPWGSAEVFQRIDPNGEVSYTDHPEGTGFKRINLKESSSSHSVAGPKLVLLKGAGSFSVVQGEGPRLFLFRPATPRGAALRHLDDKAGNFSALIERAAQAQGVDPWLLHAVIRAESSYNAQALSTKGAKGLMQLMPSTAARYGVSDPWSPEENVGAGARYLKDLLELFGKDVRLAIAAYNAGEGNVIKYGRQVPPFEETRDYVDKVLGFYGK